MVTRAERIAAEIAHGRILRQRHPVIWAWTSPAGERRARRRARWLVEAGAMRAGQQVLELGCASGSFTGRVTEASGAQLVGVDISPDLIDEARRRSPGLRFEVADAHALPFAEASFDAVFGSSTLHHLEIDAALAEVMRVLRPGGRAVFAEPNLLNPQVLAQKCVPILRRWAHEVPHETPFLRWSIARRLARAGFTEVTVRPFDFLHPLTPPLLIEPVAALGEWLERIPGLREIAGSCLIAATRPRTGVAQPR